MAQSGGLQGLANKFAQSGQGNAFQSRVGMGETSRFPTIKFKTRLVLNRSTRSRPEWEWILRLRQLSWLEYLPKIVDKLTPAGKIDPAADHQQGLAALLPSLLQSLGGQSSTDSAAQA